MTAFLKNRYYLQKCFGMGKFRGRVLVLLAPRVSKAVYVRVCARVHVCTLPHV